MSVLFDNKQLIAFDLDGTLVDTAPDLALAVDRVQAELALPARGEAKVRSWIGDGAERLVKRALTGELEAEPDADLLQRALALFREAYSTGICERSRFYPGAEHTLEQLRDGGYTLACITNKHSRFTGLLLRALGIHDHFALVLSGDTLARRKPDPLPLLHAAEQLNIAPQHMLMVGDSLTDVHAARDAGVDMVGVSYGYNKGRDIRSSEANRVIDSLIELLGLLPRAAA